MMGKKYDFDELFAGTRDTVEYWQERHDIAHGEMLVRDAEIAALKARIAELEAERRWIPVWEVMADDGVDYEAFCDDGVIRQAQLKHCADEWFTDQGMTEMECDVTHYRKLPEPPEVTDGQ